MSDNSKVLGKMAAAAAASSGVGSETLGPNSASNPIPNPLGFLVTMVDFLLT